MGVLISQSKHGEQVTHKISSIKEMFLAVFFVSIGMLVDPVLVVQGIQHRVSERGGPQAMIP